MFRKIYVVFSDIRLERKTKKRKRIFATLKVLGEVLEQMTQEVSPEEAETLIPEEVIHEVFYFITLYSVTYKS